MLLVTVLINTGAIIVAGEKRFHLDHEIAARYCEK